MRVENFKTDKKGNLARAVATVIWENRNRPSQEVYVATSAEFAQGLSCNPDTFLLACLMVAFHYGEKRLYLDAEICPELRDNLITAMNWVQHWYRCDRPLVEIEAKVRHSVPNPPTVDRAGLFFTGGIDTLANLRNNRLNFPIEHPGSIKDGLCIYGYSDTTLDNFEKAFNSFLNITNDAGITLIPVYTNIYSHIKDLEYSDAKFWRDYFTASALAAVAHAFTKRLTTVSISSSDEIPYLEPWGTHPVLDPNYSSYELKIKHECLAHSRFSKTKLVAKWNVALQSLRVCDQLILPSGYLNCGQCPKCVATMTQLAALGMLDKTNVFPSHNISEELILEKSKIQYLDEESYYLQLIPFF